MQSLLLLPVFLLFLVLSPASAHVAPDEVTYEFHVASDVMTNQELAEKLRPTCWDRHIGEDGSIKVTGFAQDRKRLQEMGINIVSEEKGRPFAADPPAGYHTPEELFEEFQSVASNFSTIAQLIDITTTYGAPLSHEGRRIYAIKISDNVAVDEDEPNVLIVSNHHSRELITPELALNTTLHLVQNYRTDANIQQLVNNNQIYIMWTMNPDGLAYVWSTDNLWRKNRNRNSGGSYGVDLNRNYHVGWDFSCGGSTIQTSEEYRGPSAASEPETKTMIMFQNERRFAKVLDFHSYAREVRIIYADCASLPSTIGNYFQDVAIEFADIIRYDQVRSCCMGGDVHFAYHDQASLSFLVETGTAFQPPSQTMKEELARVLPGTLFFLNVAIPVSGKVLDRATGAPVEALIKVNSLTFNLDEQNYSNPRNGLYHLWVPAGTWSVTVSASGYSPVTLNLVATEAGTVTNIFLG